MLTTLRRHTGVSACWRRTSCLSACSSIDTTSAARAVLNSMRQPMSTAAAEPATASGSSETGRARRENPYFPQLTYRTDYVTSRTNPLDHTFGHVGRYFTLGNDAEVKKLFPEGFTPGVKTEFETTGTNNLLIRPAGVALVHHLEAWRRATAQTLTSAGQAVRDTEVSSGALPTLELPTYSKQRTTTIYPLGGPKSEEEKAELSGRMGALGLTAGEPHPLDPVRSAFRPLRLLSGPIGIGKSSVLTYVIAYARMNKWITLSVPDSWKVMHDGLVLSSSRRRPGFVDQHDIALAMLKHTLDAQSELLAAVPQKGTYAAFRYLPRGMDGQVTAQRERQRAEEEEEKRRLKAQADAAGKPWDATSYKSRVDDESDTKVDRSRFTLKDMLEWGLNHPTAATDTLLDFIAELRQVTEYPVLIAVDGLNLMYDKTEYPLDGRTLSPEELSIPSAFHCLGPAGFRPEFAMKRGVFLGTVTQKHGKKMRMFDVANVRPRYLYRVGDLTRQETHATLLHYHHSGKFLMLSKREMVDPFAVEYYRTLCGANPAELFNAAMYQPF